MAYIYKRLNFEDYFIICSGNWNHVPTDLELAKYKSIEYYRKGKKYSVEYQVRYDVNRNVIQCIFQQTASKSDWRANFTFPHKIYDKVTYEGKLIQLKVHRGWGDMWLACQDYVREEVKPLITIHPDAEIEVFGWSLGSAIAQLCAEDLYFKFCKRVHLFTYGSVKPFYGKKTWKYVKQSCKECYNFYDVNDIVGRMVPFLGWRAMNHCKVKLDRYCITRLFNPQKYHTNYDKAYIYDKYNK